MIGMANLREATAARRASPRALRGLVAGVALAAVAGFGHAAAAGPAGCELTDDRFSESVDALTGWQSIRNHQKRFFPPCADEGAYAQTHSELVPRTLASRWTELPELAALASEAPDFQAFVLRHINARSAPGDLQTVLSYTTIRCPRQQAGLCRQIRQATAAALEQLR